MAKRPVVEIRCDRCKRVEYREVKGAQPDEGVTMPILALHFKGMDVTFTDLCTPCDSTVTSLVESIKKELKGKSPKRNKDSGASEVTKQGSPPKGAPKKT